MNVNISSLNTMVPRSEWTLAHKDMRICLLYEALGCLVEAGEPAMVAETPAIERTKGQSRANVKF